jgi:hypothetical protein
MPTYRFQEVSYREQRRIPCAGGCGKKLTRSHTFTGTINPFNKNAAGEPKTYAEVYAEQKAKGEAWQPTGMCPACTERIEGPKPVPPREILVRTPNAGGSPMLFRSIVVKAETVAEAREKAAEKLRADIGVLQARLAAVGNWTYGCYPSEKCKHGEAPCFPAEAAQADTTETAVA